MCFRRSHKIERPALFLNLRTRAFYVTYLREHAARRTVITCNTLPYQSTQHPGLFIDSRLTNSVLLFVTQHCTREGSSRWRIIQADVLNDSMTAPDPYLPDGGGIPKDSNEAIAAFRPA